MLFATQHDHRRHRNLPSDPPPTVPFTTPLLHRPCFIHSAAQPPRDLLVTRRGFRIRSAQLSAKENAAKPQMIDTTALISSKSTLDLTTIDANGLRLALEEAKKSYEEGGIPIGSVLVLPDRENSSSRGFTVLGKGHNERIQKGSPTLHGEISALENAGRQKPETDRCWVLYTTLSPCSMCAGAVLLYKIPRVVIGENHTFSGEEDLLRSRGVEVVVLDNQECKDLMKRFIAEKPEEWNEDIGKLG